VTEYFPDVLHVNAFADPDSKAPKVAWHYNGYSGTLTALEARARAEALLMACAIAESEAHVIEKFAALYEPKSKGFGKPSGRDKANQAFSVMRLAMKEERSPLPKGIEPIYGQRSRLPLVNLDLYGEAMLLELATVRDHAFALLSCAEAAESDCFLYDFLGEKLDIERHVVSGLLQEFRSFRERVQLTELLEKS
jgi:hypothetical protein